MPSSENYSNKINNLYIGCVSPIIINFGIFLNFLNRGENENRPKNIDKRAKETIYQIHHSHGYPGGPLRRWGVQAIPIEPSDEAAQQVCGGTRMSVEGES
jgi:hypothetical protein